MTITQIKYFVAVAECLNFTKAADQLYVTQQVISKQIKHLEKEIGFDLFKRDKRNVILTEGGEILYAFWVEYFDKYEKNLNKANAIMNKKKQIVRIGTIDVSKIFDWVANAVTQFSTDYPKWQFCVNSSSYLHLLQGLIDDRFDCIISLEDENTDLPEGFEETVFYRSYPKLILSEDHPAYHEGVTFPEMAGYPLLTFSTKFSKNAMNNMISHCINIGMELPQIEESNEVSSLEMALHAGQGYVLTYDFFVRNPIGKLKIIDVLEKAENSVCNFTIAYDKKKKKMLSPFIETFQKIFKEQNAH